MTSLIVRKSGPLRGAIAVPGDKSITHRALILGALAEGDTRVRGWVPAEVCLATLRCIRALGVDIAETPLWPVFAKHPCGADRASGRSDLLIHGVGLRGLAEPADVLHCAGSGTTIRLLAGLLAGQPFTSVLTGTDPLRRRPMGRVAEPLRQMGATILGRDGGRLAPLTIRGGNLRGIDYAMPIASAQVKSAILLAGLFAEGETVVHEPGPSRDHTERMLAGFEVEVKVEAEGQRRRSSPAGRTETDRRRRADDTGRFLFGCVPARGSDHCPRLRRAADRRRRQSHADGTVRFVGGDGSGIEIGRHGDTETRRRSPRVPASPRPASGQGEPLADLVVHASPLHATEAHGDLIVRAIDEFPIFAVAATQAAGTTVIREAAELRVKESDRIASVAIELRKMGAHVEERPDGMLIHGPTRLHGAVVECHRDHRLAMALAVAGLLADGPTEVRGAEAIGDSFPNFVEAMQALGAEIAWSGESGA